MSMNRQLTKATSTVVISTGVAAGTSVQTFSTTVDTFGYNAYRAICLLGALSANGVTTLQVNESTDNATWTAVTGGITAQAVVASDGGKMLIVEVYKPQKRYIQIIVNRATGNAVISAVWVELYLPDFQPTPAGGDTTNIASYISLDCPV